MSAESVEQIRRHMSRIREAAYEDVQTIVENVELATDWRYYVLRFPWATALGAALVGYLLIPRKRAAVMLDKQATEEIVKQALKTQERMPGGWLASMVIPLVTRMAVNGALAFVSNHIKPQVPPESSAKSDDLHYTVTPINRMVKPK
jgi:hypothetical protein